MERNDQWRLVDDPDAAVDSLERIARGQAARAKVPRSSHATFEPAPGRPDPIDVLERQASTRVPELVAIRYGRMLGKLRIPSTPEPGTDLGRPPSLRR